MMNHFLTSRQRAVCAVLALLGLVAMVVAACQALPPVATTSSPANTTTAAKPAGPLNLTIVHSNDTWGYLRPCG
jgi:2',3'-cyclic-nucleotide 2'-phosphodiesterase (5'-nucleotidase family)